MALASGAVFAGYTIERMLDFGAMGEVYVAQHPSLPRHDALHVLPAALSADSEFRQRFLREADAAARLYHPHILGMYDSGEFDGRLWIATECVSGTNAAQLMAEWYPSGMPAGEVVSIVAAIAGALDYAHQRGLLHRDVKPANILLTDPQQGEQRILLTGFGLAQHLGESGANLTVEAVAYAAPELLLGIDIDGRADEYALAATAFHLFTGAPPYQNSNPVAIIGQHLSATPPKLRDRRPELAPLDGVMATALAKDPANRYGRCSELADALIEPAGVWIADPGPQAALTFVDYPDDAEDGSPASAAPQPAVAAGGQPQPAPARRKWPWILLGSAAGAVVVLLCVLVVVGIMVERRNGGTVTHAPTPPARPPAAAPTSSVPATPPPGQQLSGAYQVDVDRSQQTYNGNPDPQPPDVSTWWAFRSSCAPAGCVAAGIMLDDKDHLTPSASGGDRPLVLDFRDGAWQSRPETVRFQCIGPSGSPGTQTTKQVLSLQPQGNGPMRGVMTVNVETDECGQKGAEIVIPAVAGWIGDVPPGVTVPQPPTSAETSAAPTTTPSR
jgi:serine/threonine protein kinase, bacterial